MFTSLLVGLDGSVSAQVALAQAIEIGTRFRARIVVAHIVRTEPAGVARLGASWMEWAVGSVPLSEEDARRAAKELVEDAAGAVRRAGLEAETITRRGDVVEILRELASEVGVVVVGRIGAHPTGAEESTDPLGPDTRELIRRCPRPVLVAASRPTPMDRVLVAYGGGPASEGALAYASRFAGITGARLDVLHLAPDGEEARRTRARASGALSLTPLDFDVHLAEGTLDQVVPATIARLGSNTLFVGAQRDDGGWLVPSHTETILRATDIPVLVHMESATPGARVSAAHRRPAS